MASLKRKRELASRNPLGTSSAQRRFAADAVNPTRPHLLDYEASTNNTTREHEQGGGRTGMHNHVEEDNDLIDDMAEVVMAVDMREKGTVGCCFYIAREERLSILSDTQYGGKDLIDTLKLEICPTTILTSTRAEEATMGDIQWSGDPFHLPYRIDVRPIQEYGVNSAKAKLAELEIFQLESEQAQFLVPGDGLTQQAEEVIAENAGFSFEKGKILRLGGIVDIENLVSLGCAGAVLTYIQRRRTTNYSDQDNNGTACVVRSVETFFLKGTMIVDTFLLPANADAQQKMSLALRRIKNMRSVMTNLHKGLSSGKGAFGGFKGTIWGTLLNFATHALDLQEAVCEMNWQDMIAFRDRVFNILNVSSLRSVGRIIYQTVDIEDSQEQQRTIIKQGVDRELDLLKDRYNGLDGLLKQVAVDVASTIPEELQIEVNVIYFPQLGFNIAIPYDQRGQAAYTGRNESWEQVFTTENRAYFKDERMREMDEKLGDIYGLICEREIEIAHEIAQNILRYKDMLSTSSDLCGEIDCYLAMAKTADIYKFVRPRMSTENVIRIKGGRHPLQELTVASYIPNDVNIRGGCGPQLPHIENGDAEYPFLDAPSMLLLTGPNFSGKSVYMKQIALIVYLAHIGSFVPAQSAEIGITDKILTRINTPETVSKIQSTFMLDLQQVSLLLRFGTPRSLIIIDEFGKGTDMNDGAGLACGIFEYLLSLGNNKPKVLVATHFHEIFENGFLPERESLAFGHMEVRIDEESADNKEQVTYLYNFKPGRSNQSFGTLYESSAVHCAAMNGVDGSIVERANELVSLLARGQDLVAACARMSKADEAILEEAVSRHYVRDYILQLNPETDGHHMFIQRQVFA
ncbi:hypothetical protein UA08_04558 [Talaromyces atroroseus]|uniref:DNA mismatch repair protein MSH5 n=1 Tax=Talaromyces atroroseus TaxID=1441469 RepID=A0A225AP36_TALAT|nr:hypothetical protein UA08_04558 [Talaromyces atroroseus]OKL60144.1 hypothetical protein UA08_04558 [Talaromyces atroroseus]